MMPLARKRLSRTDGADGRITTFTRSDTSAKSLNAASRLPPLRPTRIQSCHTHTPRSCPRTRLLSRTRVELGLSSLKPSHLVEDRIQSSEPSMQKPSCPHFTHFALRFVYSQLIYNSLLNRRMSSTHYAPRWPGRDVCRGASLLHSLSCRVRSWTGSSTSR